MDIHSPQGRAHAALATTSTALARRLRTEERGQGSVEYVALMLLVAGVLGAAITIAGGGGVVDAIAKQMKKAIESIAAPAQGR